MEECKRIIQRKLNKVYYDMFLEKLKEKAGPESRFDRWEDKEKSHGPSQNKKGMTWQADPQKPFEADKQFLTKVEFSKRPPRQDYI